jgi:hypothetical protein
VVNDVNEIRRGCFAADLSAVSPNRGVALPIGCCGFSSELGAVREEGRRGSAWRTSEAWCPSRVEHHLHLMTLPLHRRIDVFVLEGIRCRRIIRRLCDDVGGQLIVM